METYDLVMDTLEHLDQLLQDAGCRLDTEELENIAIRMEGLLTRSWISVAAVHLYNVLDKATKDLSEEERLQRWKSFTEYLDLRKAKEEKGFDGS